MKKILLMVTLVLLSKSILLAAEKVVVIPINGNIKPGTTIEGDLTTPILSLRNADGFSYSQVDLATSGAAVLATSSSNLGLAAGAEDIAIVGLSQQADGTAVLGATENFDYYYTDWPGTVWKPAGMFGGRNGVGGITDTNYGYAVVGLDVSATGGIGGYFRSNNSWAGSFEGPNGVYISATNVGLNVASGTKSAVVPTEDGARLMYSEESTKVWFTDYGFGQLQNGAAIINMDSVFAQTVNLEEDYHVFVQPYGDANLYVYNRSSSGFEVHSSAGESDVKFSYRVVALRLGHEDKRLARAPWADNDPNLYPEKSGDLKMVQQNSAEVMKTSGMKTDIKEQLQKLHKGGN